MSNDSSKSRSDPEPDCPFERQPDSESFAEAELAQDLPEEAPARPDSSVDFGPGSAWLVDMAYVVKAAKKCDFRLDYISAREWLAERFGHPRVYLFNSFDQGFGVPPGLEGFYHAMRQQGMTVRLHPMSGDVSAGNHKQRRVDVDIASHVIWQAARGDVDPIVLTSGDQDMIPAVEICRHEFRRKVVLLSFRESVSRQLIDAVDDHILFEKNRARLSRGDSEDASQSSRHRRQL